MMNEYEKQAVDFCNKWGIEIEWEFIGVELNYSWKDKEVRNHWRWGLKKDKKVIYGEFWGSIVDTRETADNEVKKEPSVYELLACLTKCRYDTFKDFCCEFGYDEGAKKIWKKVNAEYDDLMMVFGDNEELWKEFRNIY